MRRLLFISVFVAVPVLGSNPIQLTDDADGEKYVLVQPGGNVVIFSQELDADHNYIYTAPIDGSGGKTQVNTGSGTYWYPDIDASGNGICASGADDDDTWEICTIIDGVETYITNNEALSLDSHRPRWNHDGSKIAYCRYDWDTYTGELVVIDKYGFNEIVVLPETIWMWSIDWNNDSSLVCFTNPSNKLYTVTPLADSIPIRCGTDTSVFDCQWSFDGSKIIYVRYMTGVTEVKSINPDGTGATVLFSDSTFPGLDINGGISWTPDGNGVVFRADDGAQNDIYLTETYANVEPVSFGALKASFR